MQTEIFGWIGTILIFGAYYLVSFKKIDSDSTNYQIINLVGAAALGINVYHHRAWPALALEVVWAIIAIFALIRNTKKTNA